MNKNLNKIAKASAVAMSLGLMLTAMPVIAHFDPLGCSLTGPVLLLGVFEADGITPVVSASPGDTIYYKATLAHIGPPQCNYEGGDLDITLPDGSSVDVDGGLVTLVSFGVPFPSSLAPYLVDSANVGVDGDLDASATYAGGTSHFGDGDVTPVGATTPIATPFVKLDSVVTTEVHAPPHVDITGGSVFVGTDVHDYALVTGNGSIAPTGDVSFDLYSGDSCQGDLVIPTELVVLSLAGFNAEAESSDSSLAAGTYSYRATYGGDDNYNGDVADQCEPFTIDPVLPLVIDKTAEASWDREWRWTIDKRADEDDLDITDGQFFDVNYEVLVSAISGDVNLDISGTVSIMNPIGNPSVEITDVDDVLDSSGVVALVCVPTIPVVLDAGESINCTYSTSVSDKEDTENEVTVTTDGTIPGGSATAPVIWNPDPDDEIDECITVTDSNSEGPQGVVVCAPGPHLFQYTITFGTDVPADVLLDCGENDHPNIARFVTNELQRSGEDNWNVHITITDCFQGCTLTQGYWKTHSSYGPAAHPDDNWTSVGGPDTVFFLSGQSWIQVFKTAPKGNAYYNLAHQYMAAVLNANNGASVPTVVQDALDDAENFFNTYTPDAFNALGKKSQVRKDVIEWAGILGSYNEGLTGPGHCDEDQTSES